MSTTEHYVKDLQAFEIISENAGKQNEYLLIACDKLTAYNASEIYPVAKTIVYSDTNFIDIFLEDEESVLQKTFIEHVSQYKTTILAVDPKLSYEKIDCFLSKCDFLGLNVLLILSNMLKSSSSYRPTLGEHINYFGKQRINVINEALMKNTKLPDEEYEIGILVYNYSQIKKDFLDNNNKSSFFYHKNEVHNRVPKKVNTKKSNDFFKFATIVSNKIH